MKLLTEAEISKKVKKRRPDYGSTSSDGALLTLLGEQEDGLSREASNGGSPSRSWSDVVLSRSQTSSAMGMTAATSGGRRRRARWKTDCGGDSIRTVLDEESPQIPWNRARKVKVAVLTLLVVAMTVILLFFPEADFNTRLVTVARGDSVSFDLDQAYREQGRYTEKIMRVIMEGSFMPEEATSLAKDFVYVVARKDVFLPSEDHTEQRWQVGLLPEGLAEYFYSEQRTVGHVFDLQGIDLDSENVSLVISTDADHPVALDVKLEFVSTLVETWGLVMGAVVVVLMYAGVASDFAPRTLVTMLSATASIAVLALLDERPALEEILGWIDVETLTLLFSMMLIVSVLAETGAFELVGLWALKVARGRPWPLLTALCLLTGVISAVLDNVTTILLITPVVIQLCETLRMDARRVLIACVVFSNVGGAATAIGDPPNVLIASDPGMQSGGVTFTAFTMHAGLCVVLVAAAALATVRLMYGDKLTSSNGDDDIDDREKSLSELRHEIAIWHRTAQSMGNVSREEVIVRRAVQDKINDLVLELDEKEEEMARHGN